MLLRSVCTSHACNFRICGNESQPDLQLVEKPSYVPGYDNGLMIEGRFIGKRRKMRAYEAVSCFAKPEERL